MMGFIYGYCTRHWNRTAQNSPHGLLVEKTLCPGGHLLSPTLTTIGPVRLNDRVRDGNGCDPAGSATKTKRPFGLYREKH